MPTVIYTECVDACLCSDLSHYGHQLISDWKQIDFITLTVVGYTIYSSCSISILCLISLSLSSTGPLHSLAALHPLAVTVPCSNINGDYVLLYWWRPDSPEAQPKMIFQFDRWRDSNSRKQSNPHLQLQNHHSSGNFSFLLRPDVKDAGRYQCEVFRDDQVFAQVTVLTVLKGNKTGYKYMYDNIGRAQMKNTRALK